ncbi:MAG: cyclohydrolase-like protein [Oscillospiraceae bacterium]|jgi:IMP cyclohydrolase|nr:cyclohydrolase-like protein [Oscillospiraceae bacterium]
MKPFDIAQELQSNAYPGRGIILGKSADGKHAVIAYFIMGRSENSRNRIFVEEGEGIMTKAFDPQKLVDPSLIIYAPVHVTNVHTIVTNGDQTSTVSEFLLNGGSFEDALRSRTFEPDAPNFTPRISGILHGFDYKLSILKSAEGNEHSTRRFFYEYSHPLDGQGHFIHTYRCDGDPIPSFEGEPKLVTIEGDIDSFTDTIWESLNEDNKVSLFTRFVNIETGEVSTRIINKNK